MIEREPLAEGVAEVRLSGRAQKMAAGCRARRNRTRFIVLNSGQTYCLRDFRREGELVYREHIHHTENTPSGLIAFLCLEDAGGKVIADSQMNITELAESRTPVLAAA